jgi:hypothetical protein
MLVLEEATYILIFIFIPKELVLSSNRFVIIFLSREFNHFLSQGFHKDKFCKSWRLKVLWLLMIGRCCMIGYQHFDLFSFPNDPIDLNFLAWILRKKMLFLDLPFFHYKC